ncbi:MAG: hypothetical protein HY280_01795 [Nitrospinae bacterium]|nr:hypothetical protein [Nitrospinota bacterium]
MPTSTYSHIPAVVNYLAHTRPDSILDVGLGNGKMGFIARDFLDVMLGERFKKEDWKIKIDGLEVFPEYVQAHQRALYDEIFIGDAFDTIDNVGVYDMIIVGDVLEHFEKEKAWRFLDKCGAHSSKWIMLNIPLGEKWTQGAIYGNPHEEHLSFWRFEDFAPFTADHAVFSFPNIGEYGALLIRKDDYVHFRIREAATELASAGRTDEAVNRLAVGSKGLSPNLATEYMIFDLYMKGNKVLEAVKKLREILSAFPQEASAVKTHMEKIAPLLNKPT